VQTANPAPVSGTLQSLPALTSNPAGSHVRPPFKALEDSSVLFGFTHKRAEGVEWGLHVTPVIIADGASEQHEALLVHGIVQGGAIDAWNKQVISTGGPTAVKAVQVGDIVVAVNDKRDCASMAGMVQESSSCMLLKIEVLRQMSDRCSR